MKLSISNIAWDKKNDEYMYEYIRESGFVGIEIAPTRIIEKNPYDNIDIAAAFLDLMGSKDLEISSMQSIWFGKQERIFFSSEEREVLLNYTKKAIDFAYVLNCKNLVFGSPKNRSFEKEESLADGMDFFKSIADYAKEKGTCFSVEPNPKIYNTNFINRTSEAFEFAKQIDREGFKVNVDFGTIIQNEEDLKSIEENISLVNHIHISEPYLAIPEKREKHRELADILHKTSYTGYVSIEMKNHGDIGKVKDTMKYIDEVFS